MKLIIEMTLCRWCGKPASPDDELCQECRDALRDTQFNIAADEPEMQNRKDAA